MKKFIVAVESGGFCFWMICQSLLDARQKAKNMLQEEDEKFNHAVVAEVLFEYDVRPIVETRNEITEVDTETGDRSASDESTRYPTRRQGD